MSAIPKHSPINDGGYAVESDSVSYGASPAVACLVCAEPERSPLDLRYFAEAGDDTLYCSFCDAPIKCDGVECDC
jgi:hypothetical protein